ncbi:MAG TPA: ATP-binding protein [Candidatus Limosilactobacillus merdigallinarum]|uniref:ATP-binding protein n=1 Tax=Candidatus Limosilactobacillus merdigallinarum TaxID=2838652 RepID=A0A9D1VI99_9LACO|nr:ATP-binding protein [Candidatus Limosilactobacillus merdigallinarum]
MIKRESYMKRLNLVRDKQIIKVLTGVRRSGKSTILKMYEQRLKEQFQIADNQIQHLNFEDLGISDLQDYRKLYNYLNQHLVADKMNYIFFDEIQNVPHFEKALDSLFIKKNVDLYVTGSNAFMFSGELSTLLSGRYIEIHVFPLSFREFLPTVNDEDKKQAFDRYLSKGGFPFATQLNDNQTYYDYIDGIVNTVLVKDILSRKERGNANLVKELAKYLTDTTGNLITPRKIAGLMTSKGIKISPATVSSYLKNFTDAFLFYKCDRYDISGKRYLTINSKYYTVDPALRIDLLGTKRPNFGSRLENIVYLELLRRGYEVYVGSLGSRKIDFVAIKNGVKEYYQVSLSVKDEQTYQREVRGFQQIHDNFPKRLITEDSGYYNDNGIEQINVIDWLLS